MMKIPCLKLRKTIKEGKKIGISRNGSEVQKFIIFQITSESEKIF
jgi:hypothetical protein